MSKLALAVSKFMEIMYWCVVVVMAAVLGAALFAKDQLYALLSGGVFDGTGLTLSTCGFEVAALNANGEIDRMTLLVFALGALVLSALMALIFRNIYLVIRSAKNDSPFRRENVCRLRLTGFFAMAIPLVGLLLSVVIRLVSTVDMVEAKVSMNSFVMGIMLLCLTQFFAHGVALQQDVDELL